MISCSYSRIPEYGIGSHDENQNVSAWSCIYGVSEKVADRALLNVKLRGVHYSYHVQLRLIEDQGYGVRVRRCTVKAGAVQDNIFCLSCIAHAHLRQIDGSDIYYRIKCDCHFARVIIQSCECKRGLCDISDNRNRAVRRGIYGISEKVADRALLNVKLRGVHCSYQVQLRLIERHGYGIRVGCGIVKGGAVHGYGIFIPRIAHMHSSQIHMSDVY